MLNKLQAMLCIRLLLVGLLLFGLMWCGAVSALAQDKAQLGKELIEAARAGEADRVKELLAQGADVATGDEKSGKTALHYAALRGDVELIKFLLAKQTTATGLALFPDGDNDFPFHDAVRGGNIEAVKLLVNREDVNKADSIILVVFIVFLSLVSILVVAQSLFGCPSWF